MTCEACGDPIGIDRSYGRFHRCCVERLLAAQRRPEIPDWMRLIADVAADTAALELGACPCPCHRVIQPGLVPCPTCGGPREHLFDPS